VPLAFAAIPTELADGRFSAPAWAIRALGGAVIVGAAIYLVLRLRKRSEQDKR
jgi:hypothetical protein